MRTRLLTALLALSMAACGGALNPAPTSDAGCNDPLCSGGFDDKDDPKAVGTLTGTAFRDGLAAQGVTAHLIAEDGSIVRTSTDATGVFKFDLSPARYKLVLNDARGRGGYESFVLFGGGVNDLGRLELVPLETVPGILDLQGVGFEERLTRQAGDYLYPVFDSTRSFVYAARKLGGDSGYDILKVAIPGGQETLLAAKVDLSSSYSSRLELVSDRVLAYWATRQDPDSAYLIDSLVFVDVQTGKELAVESWRRHGGHFEVNGSLYVFESQSSRVVGDTLFGDVQQYTWALVRIDPATGARTQGPILGSIGWSNGFGMLEHDSKNAMVLPQHGCGFDYAMQHPADCDASYPGSQGLVPALVKVDLSTLVDRKLCSASSSTKGSFSADGSKFYVLESGADANGSTTVLNAVDVATGARSALLTRSCKTERCFTGLYGTSLKSPVAEELLVQTQATDAQGQYTAPGYGRIDLAAKTLAELPMTWTIEGTSQDLYQKTADWSGYCTASWLPDGKVRLQAMTAPAAQRYTLVVDVPASTASAVARRFPMGQEDSFPTMIAGGGREIVQLRDLATGFFQLWGGTEGAALPAMSPSTFLTANHRFAALTADGKTVYYFTRDPISGYEQLFRVSLP